MAKTNFDGKVAVLSHLFLHYADEENLKDFMEHNDLGLPFAYGLESKMIDVKPSGKKYIEEAFDGLLEALEIEDTGFDSWDDVEDILSN
jgi:hypothetical protein